MNRLSFPASRILVYSHSLTRWNVFGSSSSKTTTFYSASMKLPLKAASKNAEWWHRRLLCIPDLCLEAPTSMYTILSYRVLEVDLFLLLLRAMASTVS